ncbi:MAG: hypothetical protein NT164_08830 [Verrucomicrobiae bacterium]|nr:hypothetical protein [Verrucomicrobiae bacterium]
MVAHPWLHHLSKMSVLFRMGGLLSVIAGAVALFMSMGWVAENRRDVRISDPVGIKLKTC